MNKILEECKKYDLIGVGELTHGELTSWKYRYKIVKYLTKYFNKVIIFCETLDPYISNLNNKNNEFNFYNYPDSKNSYSEFYPFMMFNANKTTQHLQITKKFNKLVPKVKFYGIDIQIVKYLDMYNILDPKLKKIIDKYKKIYLDDSISGIARNKCNSSIINDLILDNRKKNKNNIFIYFAHNEHIGLNCNSTRKNNKYKTEGFYLNENPKIKYLSIATFSPVQYSLWECSFPICKIKKYITKSKKWDKIFREHNNKTVIINKNHKLPMLNDYYTSDFNFTIADNENIIPVLLKV
jgi:hypothetical protein